MKNLHQRGADQREMKSKWTTKLVLWALYTSKIEVQDRTHIINALLANMGVLPIKDVVSLNEQGGILLRGKPITDADVANNLRQGATAVLDNGTRRIVKEQLMVEAGKILLYKSKTPEDLLFAKAIIWVALTEDNIYNDLAK